MQLGMHLPHAGSQASPALIKRHAQRAEDVHVELALDLLDSGFLDRAPQDVACVVDDSVEPTLALDNLPNGPRHRAAIGHVDLEQLARLGQIGSRTARITHAGIDTVPCGGELLADQPAEATRTSRDEADGHSANLHGSEPGSPPNSRRAAKNDPSAKNQWRNDPLVHAAP